MDVTRVTAKTLDEAITKAAIDLGTSSDNLEYTIEEQKSGIFGLGKSVTIKAHKKEEGDLDDLYAAVVEGREEKKPAQKAAPEQARETVKDIPRQQPAKDYVKPAPRNEFKDQKKDEPKKEVKKEKKDNRKEFKTEFKTESKYEVKSMKGKEKEPKNAEKEAPKKEQKPVQKPAQKQPQAQKDSQKNNQKNSYRESIEAEKEALRLAEEMRAEKERDRKENKKPSNIEACRTAATDFLIKVFAAMDMKVDVDTIYDDEEVELIVNLSGEDMGILIGKRGQTLDSLQYLVSLVVNKQTEGYLRVKLDTENYRARRKQTLEQLAKNIAFKVRRTRHSVSLEPMNPYERRIIHATLQNDRYVVTRSEGEEPYRHVVVSMKREARERDRRGGYSRHNSLNNQNNQNSQESGDAEE